MHIICALCPKLFKTANLKRNEVDVMPGKKENLVGYAFIAPALVAFLILVAFPFVSSIFLSFTEWNFVSGWEGIRWVGLKNFKALLTDRNFTYAVKNTFIYAITTVPTSILLALVLAYILNGKVFGKKIFRTCFFIPYISSIVALSAVFKFLFRDDGIVNNLLRTFGLEGIKWMADESFTKLPIILLMIYTAVGYNLIIYMAAIQNVPKEYYEASMLDGATSFKQFCHITFPLISPTTFYLLVVRLIAAFKVFASINIFVMGDYARSNTSLVVEVYEKAFRYYKFGYASAEAFVLFVIILIITLFNFWGQKKWVTY